jgi:hypothetical protein
MSWEADLEAARRRVAALDPERELASALKAAASERFINTFSGFFLPLPPVAQPRLSLYGGFIDPPERENQRPIACTSTGTAGRWRTSSTAAVRITCGSGTPTASGSSSSSSWAQVRTCAATGATTW